MSSNQLIESLMTQYEEVLEKQKTRECLRYSDEIPLPIDKVDGLKCYVGFVLRKQSIQLQITSCDVLVEEYCGNRILYQQYLIDCIKYNDKNKEFKKEDFVMALVNLKKLLSELKFDKFYGEFRKETDTRFGKDFATLLADINNIKLTCNDCCVCSVTTNTKTPCRHHLCVECWDRITIQYEGVDNKKMSCPICRENIMFIKDDE
jgi:hypothetical protein